jgi:hypothetical protein
MKRLFAGGILMTGALAFGIVAFTDAAAQTPPQPTPTTQAPSQQAAAGESITLTGCVQREADYRQANNLNRGGTAGTGAGVGNEYVLVNASRSSGASPGAPGTATGTTGAAPAGSAGDAYELTGPNEGEAKQHVGKRVEIVGKLKPGETGPAGGATGGATAGAPPRGVDVTSQDLKLREVEITSIRETSGTCPTMQK